MVAMRSRYYGNPAARARAMGQRTLTLAPLVAAYLREPGAVRASAPSSGPGFWSQATTTEKGVIVVAGAGAAVLLYLALAK